MNKIQKYLNLAKKLAVKGESKDASRQYRFGVVGIRSDGATVTSNNVPNRKPDVCAHAEYRITRKLDMGATVFVVRITRDGTMRHARPCPGCQRAMQLRRVKKCIYSINEHEYGVMEF